MEKNDGKELEKVEEAKTIEQEPVDNRKGLSISSMVLGICSIVFCSHFFISVACGVLAIIFGLKGKKRAGVKMATAGFITGIIGLCLEVVLLVIGIILGAAILGAISSAL